MISPEVWVLVCGIAALFLLCIHLLLRCKVLKEQNSSLDNARRTAACAWRECAFKLEAAEKALIDLEGQTPGRDKTGRFVKREKVSVEKV